MSNKTDTNKTLINSNKKQNTAWDQKSYLSQWYKGDITKSAQYQAGKRGAKKALEQYGNTLRWLGGGDRE